ncbi:hypothetical protein LJC27_07465 [Christensenellaceae bacterium OttesenSCG-928-M15]|nr:hypothetical protein [Christensenellaceae bacterium OttesenSCG-928-M15]
MLLSLYVSENEILSLDLSGAPGLTLVNVMNNRLEFLDVSMLPALDSLYVQGNDGITIEFGSANPATDIHTPPTGDAGSYAGFMMIAAALILLAITYEKKMPHRQK